MIAPLLTERGLRVAEHYLLGPEPKAFKGVRPKRLVKSDSDFAYATYRTGRALALGASLAAMDGPLPVGDVLGLAVASAGATLAWVEYFTREA